MKYRVKDLRELMKQNGIKGGSMMIKQELIDILREKQLLPEPLPGKPIKPQQECSKQKIPTPVTLEDIKTGEITSYPSLYRAGRSLHKSPCSVMLLNGRVMSGKYNVTVLSKKMI